MTILGNVNAHQTGRKVAALTTSHRRLSVNFPGWGDPNYADHLLPIPAGLAGVVTDVESHGSNPWTRYSVRFADGTTASGLCLGTDIEFAPVEPGDVITVRVTPGVDPEQVTVIHDQGRTMWCQLSGGRRLNVAKAS